MKEGLCVNLILVLSLFALAAAAVLLALATDVVADEVSRVTEAAFDYIEFRRASQAAHKELLDASVHEKKLCAY